MRPDFVIVSTPILHFLPGVVKAQEPMRVQAFAPELAVEGFNEAIVRRLARPREVEHDTLLVSPDIEIARYKLRSLVDADRLRIAHSFTDALEGQNDVFAAIAEAWVDRRRKSTEGVDDGQHADLAAGGKLIVNEVHGPGLIDLRCVRPIFAQLSFDPASGCFIAQLQA